MTEVATSFIQSHMTPEMKRLLRHYQMQEYVDARKWRKQQVARKREWLKIIPSSVPIEPHRYYEPREVAAILNVSYDTARRRMKRMTKQAVELGASGTRRKQQKELLRVQGSQLSQWLQGRKLE